MKRQVLQRPVEGCMLGSIWKDQNKNRWFWQRRHVTDVVHRIQSIKWQLAGHPAWKTDNRGSTAKTLRYPEMRKKHEDAQDEIGLRHQETSGHNLYSLSRKQTRLNRKGKLVHWSLMKVYIDIYELKLFAYCYNVEFMKENLLNTNSELFTYEKL